MAFLVNFSLSGSAIAGDTPAATVVAPSPFPVVASFITNLFSPSSFCLLTSYFWLSHALRHDFSRGFHVFGGGACVYDGRALARNVSRSERLALEYAVQNFFDPEGETVGLREARDLRFTIAGAQNRGELAEAVNALVVHLDRDDPLEFFEDFLETVRQRMEMTQMQRADFLAVFARHSHCVVNRAVS